MISDDRKTSPSALDETIAGTGPGIADDALSPGKDLPDGPSDEDVEKAAIDLGVPGTRRDSLPLDGE